MPEMRKVDTPEKLIAVWPYVEKGIKHLMHRNRKCSPTFTTNHVFMMIKNGLPSAQPRTSMVELHVAYEGANPIGFIVLYPFVDPFLQVANKIYVWLINANFDLMERFWGYLTNIAIQNGVDTIEFDSPRAGWIRKMQRLSKLGFAVRKYTFCAKVS